MRPPGARTSAEWAHYVSERLSAWWEQWESSLHRHDDLAETVAAGENFAMFAKQTGLGRQKWLAEALIDGDMFDRRVLVLCPPAVRRHWCQELLKAGFAADRIAALSAWQASRGGIRAQAALLRQIDEADVVIIEPPCRPGTKLFAALALQVREAGRSTQIITTTTLIWGSATAPPRYVDACLKLIGYLEERPIKVCWADDCWEART